MLPIADKLATASKQLDNNMIDDANVLWQCRRYLTAYQAKSHCRQQAATLARLAAPISASFPCPARSYRCA